MITLHELTHKIRDTLSASRKVLPHDTPLLDALGQIVATDIYSPIAIPSDDVSAMDGYAIHCGEKPLPAGTQLRLIGLSKAGMPFFGKAKHPNNHEVNDSLQSGECVRIMTGAVVPAGADSVVMQEDVEAIGTTIILQREIPPKKNIRYRGEEIAEGGIILKKGRIITPTEVLLLASCGFASVKTTGKLKVGIFSTGDELVEPGQKLSQPGQIYDSNRITIQALLRTLPVDIVDYGLIPDNLESTETALRQASYDCDVIITSGGVSVGDFDYLNNAISRIGKTHQYKVKMKPGKPFLFGEIGSAWFFGLPGNPVSGFVGFTQIIAPSISYLLGIDSPTPLSLQVPLAAPLTKRHDRLDFQRGYLQRVMHTEKGDEEKHDWKVTPQERQDSHRIYALSQANCLISLLAEEKDKSTGELVTVIPFLDKFNMGEFFNG